MNDKGKLYGLVAIAGLALLFTGCIYYGDAHRSTGRVIDDRGIAGRVRGSLGESPVYKFPYVNVSTFNGVVQLSGFVTREEQKAEAGELARRVPGVVEVINNISLEPPGITSPYEPVSRPRDSRTNLPPRGS